MNTKRRNLYIYALAVAVVLFMNIIRLFPLELLELRMMDFYLENQTVNKSQQKVVLIIASNKSMSDMKQWPWSRDVWTSLINDNLNEARTIALDLLLIEETEHDDELADAMERHGNVLLAYHLDENINQSRMPVKSLYNASGGVGFVNIDSEIDGSARKFALARYNKDKTNLVPSFPYAVYLANGGDALIREGDRSFYLEKEDVNIPLDNNFDYYKRNIPSSHYQVYEFSDVYNGLIPKSEFEDAVCFVGVSATGTEDAVNIPDGVTPGTRYLADSYYSISSDINPLRSGVVFDGITGILLLLACGLLCYRLPMKFGWLVPFILSVGWIVLSYTLFNSGVIYVSAVSNIVSIWIGFLVSITASIVSTRKEFDIQSLSTETLLLFTENAFLTTEEIKYEDALSSISHQLKETADLKIIKSYINKSEMKKTSEMKLYRVYEDKSNKYYINIPLPSLENEDQYYTILGSNHKLSEETIKSVSAWIVSLFIYVKSINDRADSQRMLYDIIQCMVAAVDAKDPITSGHSRRVSDFAVKIAEWTGLDKQEREKIRLAGLIHDIGKIGIPDNVLNKPGRLTDEEFKTMKLHPGKGHEIMSNMTLPEDTLKGILHHHERIDGKGYPDNISGDSLSMTAKILKIADVYDALISERQYKKAWPIEKVCEILYEGRGTEFDEDIVMTTLENIKPEGWEYEEKK